ncbi:MAG TPA: PAS domain S-box protein [Bacteroidia bacterium]|nr:PAS domain S-box protein [Bacteroidia bacterium]
MADYKKHKILLADDHSRDRSALKIVLQQNGFSVGEASSAADALHMLAQESFGLILINADMPGADPAGFTEQLGARTKEQVPVVMISSTAPDLFFRSVPARGINDFLPKPVDKDLLLLKAHNLLSFFDTAEELRRSQEELNRMNLYLELKAIRSEISYKSLYESSPDEIFILDKNGVVSKMNRDYVTSAGFDTKEYIGKPFAEAPCRFSLMNGESIVPLLQLALAGKTGEDRTEIRMTGRDGNALFGEMTFGTFVTGSGEDQLQVIVRDITQRKLAEIRLAEREQQLHEVTASIPGVVYQYKVFPGGKMEFTFVSEGSKKTWGLAPEEVYADSTAPFRSIHPEDYERVMNAIDESNHSVRFLSVIFRIVMNGGKIKWLMAESVPHMTGDGILVRNGSVTDITREKEARLLLEESERNFRTIVETTDQMINTTSTDGKILWANRAFLDATGYSSDEITGMHIKDLLDESIRHFYPERARKVLSGTTIHGISGIMIRKDGERIFTDGTITPLVENGVITGIRGFFLNVTEQKKAEELLRKNRERYKRVVDNISDGLVIDDPSGRIVFANDQFLHLFALTRNDLLQITLEDIVAPEYRQKIRDRHERRIAGENVPSVFEFRGLRKDGTSGWFEVRVSPILENGQITGTQSAVRDITDDKNNLTELIRKEAELEKLVQDLTNKKNELTQFNYIVSHNLRSPIANIIGLTRLLEMTSLSEADRAKAIVHIRDSSHKLDEIVKDLSNILAARSGISSQKERLDIREIVRKASDILETQILESNCIINVNIAKNAGEIFSVKSYLESIIYNLLNNAIKYRAAGRRPEITVSSKKENGNIILAVADNGNGIDLERHGKDLFGLYKRFNSEKEGKGLGLHMTKLQVETLGGKISVASTVGTGTTFTLTLPTG